MRVTKTLAELVVKEAKNIRKHATKKEIGNLELKRLDPNSINDCIYGQMTGHCYSQRANELILVCAERVYIPINYNSTIIDTRLNGKPHIIEDNSDRRYTYHSPIEKYILLAEEKKQKGIEKLVKFLKGERKTLSTIDLM